MPLSSTFSLASANLGQPPKTPRKSSAPFSIRLTEDERVRLLHEAGGVPLGSYIKAKALDGHFLRKRRSGGSIEDRQALARLLALMGQSRLFAGLQDVIEGVASGSIEVTPQMEAALDTALANIGDIRDLLIQALGMKPEAGR